jgi:hypothetical protein
LARIKRDWIEFAKLHKDSMEDDDIFMKELAPRDAKDQSA